ncbi:unnamed protein product [Parnassius mnemosyne]|uniref:FP protein C-terminal domain-containing protein n=1 Tax=Parnassius mnemosyne TaxID=213953 RepID=A0AAV1LMI6_9NEOP
MQRSPPNKRHDSDPDLSNISIRKRKNDHDITESFQSFTDTIFKKMDSWKTEFDKNLSQINHTLNDIIKKDLTKLKEDSMELKTEIKNARKEYTEVKACVAVLSAQQSEMQKDIITLQKSVQFNSDWHDETTKKIEVLSEHTKKTDNLKSEINNLKLQNQQLNRQMNINEQRDRLLNVELVGIPESINEDLNDTIFKICKHIGVAVNINDILQVNRVSPKVKLPGRSRVIIAKMKSRLLKDNLISLSRKNRLSTEDIGLAGESRPIFINEHLTSHNKQLLKKCKDFAKLNQYQFVWTKNGRIFVRRNDTSPGLQIFDEEDLKKIITKQ